MRFLTVVLVLASLLIPVAGRPLACPCGQVAGETANDVAAADPSDVAGSPERPEPPPCDPVTDEGCLTLCGMGCSVLAPACGTGRLARTPLAISTPSSGTPESLFPGIALRPPRAAL